MGDHEQKTMQKMYLNGIGMGSEGFVTLSSMLLTNFSIRTLCLSNNGVDDHCMALLAQSLSRNKGLPLEVIQLSFNQISDAGVECFMNAVWGSQTLKEIRDRGAQLASVVLTSIKLEVIDLSFNKVTTVGIKALMKSLSENASLLYLGLSGISIDANAAKALSYGLAYNSTLRYLHVDNCQIGYAAQRHIIAGVVSNRLASLRVLTGFPVGTICTTLGLPKPLEDFTNDQCLSFIRRMWKQWRDENGFSNKPLEIQAQAARSLGPAAPPDVVRASRMALQLLGPNGAAALQTEDHQKDLSETSPLVHTNDIMLERTASGTLRVPSVAQDVQIEDCMTVRPPQVVVSSASSALPQVEQAQKDRNLQWLRAHVQSLHQVGNLPFNEADLWKLHQYFFSPLVPVDGEQSEKSGSTSSTTVSPEEINATVPVVLSPPSPQSHPVPFDAGTKAQLGRALSFQALGDASSTVESLGSFSTVSNYSNRRRTLGTMEEKVECDESSTSSEEGQPVSKRARNFRPRISFYPRIRSLLENLGTKQSQHQCLSLLRQLKFVESVLFQGRDAYGNELHQPDEVTPADLEMIILDLL
jgi:Leucine Rich repeat